MSRPDVGDTFPDATLTDADGRAMTLDGRAGKKRVIFFYPKDDTPGCTAENKAFSGLADEFAVAEVDLLGVSKDPPARHAKFAAKHALTVPLASDSAIDGLAEKLGIWVEKRLYGRIYMGMERTTYLIDAECKIARVWRKVKVAGHAAEVLEAARALG